MRWAGLGAAALLLAACSDPWKLEQPQVSAGAEAGGTGAPFQPYCYRTLADVDCYYAQLPEEGGRRVDWSGHLAAE